MQLVEILLLFPWRESGEKLLDDPNELRPNIFIVCSAGILGILALCFAAFAVA